MSVGNTEIEHIRQVTREFFLKELAPNVMAWDDREEFPKEIFQKFAKTGFHAVNLPEEYGGGGNIQALSIVAEEISRIDPAFGLSLLASSQLFGYNVAKSGTQGQKDKYLNAMVSEGRIGCWALTEPDVGSNAIGIKMRAEKDGDHFILNGSKTFITNAPIADYFLVIAREFGEGIEGMTAFILERDQEGMELGVPLKKMGNRTSPTGEIFLKNCRVSQSQVLGQPGGAFLDLKHSLDLERLVFAGLGIGIAREALHRSTRYALERKQFGKKICEFQMVQDMIADMAGRLEYMKAYNDRVFDLYSQGKNIHFEATTLKYMSTTMVMEIVDKAVQVHGGNGYMREYFVEKLYRDSRLFSIGGGTSEIIKIIMAKETFKREMN